MNIKGNNEIVFNIDDNSNDDMSVLEKGCDILLFK